MNELDIFGRVLVHYFNKFTLLFKKKLIPFYHRSQSHEKIAHILKSYFLPNSSLTWANSFGPIESECDLSIKLKVYSKSSLPYKIHRYWWCYV